jgi:hypothetical protein
MTTTAEQILTTTTLSATGSSSIATTTTCTTFPANLASRNNYEFPATRDVLDTKDDVAGPLSLCASRSGSASATGPSITAIMSTTACVSSPWPRLAYTITRWWHVAVREGSYRYGTHYLDVVCIYSKRVSVENQLLTKLLIKNKFLGRRGLNHHAVLNILEELLGSDRLLR